MQLSYTLVLSCCVMKKIRLFIPRSCPLKHISHQIHPAYNHHSKEPSSTLTISKAIQFKPPKIRIRIHTKKRKKWEEEEEEQSLNFQSLSLSVSNSTASVSNTLLVFMFWQAEVPRHEVIKENRETGWIFLKFCPCGNGDINTG